MAGRSSLLVMVLGMGTLFSLLYISTIYSDNAGKTMPLPNNQLATPPQTTYIDIEAGASDQSANKGYSPKDARVILGQNNRVVWTNNDSVPSSVVSDSDYVDKVTGKRLDSGLILPNSSFEFVFTKPGEYSYHSEPHPWMHGTISVVEQFG